MTSPFTITAPTNTIILKKDGQGEAAFTVSNISGGPIRGRALLVSDNPAAAPWLEIKGETERDYPIAGIEQYTVQIAAPQEATTGNYVFRLDMVGVENPDELYSQGPTVTFQVPEEVVPPKRIPWWIFAIAGGVVLIGVLAFLLWPRNTTVPDLAGLTLSEAIAELSEARLELAGFGEEPHDTVPSGRVVSSEPVAGTSVRRGFGISLLVSTGPANATVPVVSSLTVAEANLKIVQAGLTIGTTTQEFSTIPTNRVIRADPAEGELVALGSAVNLVVSKGLAPLVTISVAADADMYWDPIGTLYIVGQVPDFARGRKLVLWNASSRITRPFLGSRGPGLVAIHFPLGAIPPGAGIEKAILGLNLEAQSVSGLQVNVRQIITPWTETNGADRVTTQSRGQVTRVVSPSTLPAFIEWDVTALVRTMVEDPSQNFGLALSFVGETGSRTFTSREGTAPQLRPRLEISYR